MTADRAILLLTRPEAQSRRFAAEFRARFGADWPILISPLMRIARLSPALPTVMPDDIIFTSENAVTSFAGLSSGRGALAWCVGERTERAAKMAGFDTRRGSSDAAGLIDLIRAEFKGRSMIWPRGSRVTTDIAEALKSAGIETISLVVYDQMECQPSAAATALLQASDPVLLPLFSARSARLFLRAFPVTSAPVYLAAISPAVAEAAAMIPAARRNVARRPDAAAMHDALANLLGMDNMG